MQSHDSTDSLVQSQLNKRQCPKTDIHLFTLRTFKLDFFYLIMRSSVWYQTQEIADLQAHNMVQLEGLLFLVFTPKGPCRKKVPASCNIFCTSQPIFFTSNNTVQITNSQMMIRTRRRINLGGHACTLSLSQRTQIQVQ